MTRPRVAVVGGGLGGLAAAGLLQRNGCDVSLFERSDRLGGKARAERYGDLTLDSGPTLVTLPEWIRDLFAALDAERLLPELLEVETQCGYRFADGTGFSSHRSLERTADAVGGLEHGAEARMARFYRLAERIYQAAGEPYLERPYEGGLDFLFRVMRRGLPAIRMGVQLGTLAELAADCFKGPALRQFVGRFATYAGASPFRASAAFALIPHIERAFGAHHPRGGVGALAEALVQAVRSLGVAVQTGVAAQGSKLGSRFRLTRENRPTESIGEFDALVVNADPLSVLSRTAEPLSLSGYVVAVEVERRLELSHHAVRFSPDDRSEFEQLFGQGGGRVPEEPTVYLCHPAATDRTMAPPGSSGVMMMVNAPALPPENLPGAEALRAQWRAGSEMLHRLREYCLDRLFELAPEARGHARILSERTPLDLESLGAPGGSIYGFLPHGRFGPFRRPRIRGRTPGLFFAGGGTHPGGGVPLVLRSGCFAAELALEYLGLKTERS